MTMNSVENILNIQHYDSFEEAQNDFRDNDLPNFFSIVRSIKDGGDCHIYYAIIDFRSMRDYMKKRGEDSLDRLVMSKFVVGYSLSIERANIMIAGLQILFKFKDWIGGSR